VLGGVAAIAPTSAIIWVVAEKDKKPDAPLTAELKGATWAEESAAFERRLRIRFPTGSGEQLMSRELRRQGFKQVDWGGATGVEHEAERREDDFVCNRAAYVFWRADASGQLTSVRGEYREEGCL
jgi:hypothetical protein